VSGSDRPQESSVEVALDLEEGYRFGIRFESGPGVEPRLVMDEPPPLGAGAGPNAARVLAAAVGDCLSASLLFCLRRARVDVRGMRTVTGPRWCGTNAAGSRVGDVRVAIHPEVAGDRSRLDGCVELFEDFCVVTDSVRRGLPVAVEVEPAETPGEPNPAQDRPIPVQQRPVEEPLRGSLPRVARVLAVLAHPDDESFGLGAVLDTLVRGGTKVWVLSLTKGERGQPAGDIASDPAAVRSAELAAAAQALGLERAEVLAYPDGGLAAVPLDELAGKVGQAADHAGAELLLVFDEGSVTGHPDHQRATQAALSAARQAGLPVLAWALPRQVAEAINAEYGTAFVGRDAASLPVRVEVERSRQWQAISRHTSQAAGFPLVARRLELLGNREYLRWLLAPDAG
jgi:N-acetylglucosamine malate deacetylase 2